MKKQTCLHSQIGLLSHILHPLGRSLADKSPLFIPLSFIIIELLWEVFSQDHGNEKKVIFDISSRKKQRKRSPNLKLNKHCAILTNEKIRVQFLFHQ